MNSEWLTSPNARRVLQHDADPRPAWLWSQDGQSLLWHNRAAGLFLAKLKKHGLKLAPPAVPIKGQVARNIRLGSTGRSSLARIQFLAGDKPASITCAATPLVWQDEQKVLLIVGVDPINADILNAADAAATETTSENIQPPADATEAVGTPEVVDTPEPLVPPEQDSSISHEADESHGDAAAWAAEHDPSVHTPESDDDIVTHSPDAESDESAYARELDSWRAAEQDPITSPVDEPAAVDEEAPAQSDDAAAHQPPPAMPEKDEGRSTGSRLSQLVDRLAANDALYTPLTEADDTLRSPVSEIEQAPETDESSETDLPAEIDAPEADQTEQQGGALFRVTGRGFISEPVDAPSELPGDPDVQTANAPQSEDTDSAEPHEEEADEPADTSLTEETAASVGEPDLVERVSRYNFDELSRILNDRVSDTGIVPSPRPTDPQRSGALVSLSGETLVLNRLPLGILVFRDQQVLFANRAITEMVGYESVEALRAAGLAAVFPAAGPDDQQAGPVNHLVQRDGTLVPVTARLQSISWHGRPALMLSASGTEVRTGHEGAVNAFAQTIADVGGDGFFEATRAGVISSMTPKASALLGLAGAMEGKPLTTLISGDDVPTLRTFLERPARFAETERPWLKLPSSSGKADIIVFAQGQAGVVTGYFGFVRGKDVAPVRLPGPVDADPALLSRISRGVRRPLNSIIGFADLMRTTAGTTDTEALTAYARDISTAGQDIAALVDELEDYARLRDGRYLPQRASIDLTALLESCVLRIRQQASNARVLVRNAISETLPRLTADRASLEQAVLNLLASAIDQSPNGGAVVISAQHQEDGGIAVHVRDSSVNAVDMAERFVVFRDGPGRDGKMLEPVRSSVGLALTRSLLAVNAFSLAVDPAGETGMLFTLKIPADLIERETSTDVAE